MLISGIKYDMLSTEELREIVRNKIKRSSRKVVAIDLGISYAYLTDFLNGSRKAGPKIVKALGYRTVIAYERVQ